MLMAKAPASRTHRPVVDDRLAQKRTSAGSSDTDVKEFTVIPAGSDPARQVTTLTPVAKWLSTWRRGRCPVLMVVLITLIERCTAHLVIRPARMPKRLDWHGPFRKPNRQA